MKFHENIIEQVIYTTLRYLVWIVMPVVFANSSNFIANLTLVSLLSTTLFTSVVSGPIFYREINSGDLIKRIPSDMLVVLVAFGLSVVSSFIYSSVKGFDFWFFIESVIFSVGLSLFEWMRRKYILTNMKIKALQAYAFYAALFIGVALFGYFYNDISSYSMLIGLAGLLTFLLYRKNNMLSINFRYFESIKISALYLFSGIFAYLAGNGLFWKITSPSLDDFIVIRTFFTPVMVSALFIDVYGPELISLGKSRIYIKYLSVVFFFSIAILGLLVLLSQTIEDFLPGVSYGIYFLAASIVALISVNKYPVVKLRLEGKEMVQTVAYGIMTFVVFIFPDRLYYSLKFFGLEVLFLSYLLILLSMSFYARTEKDNPFYK